MPKISELTAATSVSPDDLMVIVQDGETKRATSALVGTHSVTPEEQDAGVIVVNYRYPPGDVRRYGAAGDNSTDDTAALQACATVCALSGDAVYLPAGIYRVSETIEFPHNTVVYGDGAKVSSIRPHSSWTPSGESYVVRVKQNAGAAGADNNYFVNWRDFGVSALGTANLGCVNFNAGGGSTLERMYLVDGGTGADQLKVSYAELANVSAVVAQRFSNLWIGSTVTSSINCRNGVVIESAYTVHFDSCIFDYVSAGGTGDDGFAVKVQNSAGVTFTNCNMEGNPRPFYSNSSGWQLVGGAIYRKGLGSSASTDADFCFEVAASANNMPSILGTRIFQGYGISGGSGGIAKVYGGSTLGISASTNGEINYINARSTHLAGAISSGVQFGNAESPSVTTLNYYSEQSFTPTIVGSVTAGTGTYTAQVGRATRIGNRVFFDAVVGISAHTGAGNLLIGGLPFTALNVANYRAYCSVSGGDLTFTGLLTGYIAGSTDYVVIQVDATGAASSAVALDTACTICVSGCYAV